MINIPPIEIHLTLPLDNMILSIILDNQLLKELKEKEELIDKQLQPDKPKFIKDKELIHMLKLMNRDQHQEDLLELKFMNKHCHEMKDLKLLED